jgi:hypothetical protein
MDFIQKHRSFKLLVESPRLTASPCNDSIVANPTKIVTITAERFVYRDIVKLMLFTHDEEDALALRAAFVPGQLKEVYRKAEESFADGFFKGLVKGINLG